MKKGLILISLIMASLFIPSTEIKATSVTEQSYSAINEFDRFTNVVIFIKFQDEVDYQAPYDFDYYNDMFNGVDMISLRDYFLEVSYNQLTIDSVFTHETIVFFVDDHDRNYYQPYDEETNPNGFQNDEEAGDREHELLKKAVDWVEDNNLIDDSVDLDVNNDGDIDSLTFMVSGEDNGWNNLLWPHKWEMYAYYDYDNYDYTSDAPKINGFYAWSYTFELLGNSRAYEYKVDVGVLAHETFHLISAPDLYHYYEYSWIDPVGEWGLMSNTGTIPSHMLGYMKYQYGNWIDSVQSITESGQYTLQPLQDNANNIYKIPLGYSNEYIYLEYRDDDGVYESTLPSTGLLVYRVDEDFYDIGNVNGYYNNEEAAEEVWVYRAGMFDDEYPIEFSSTEPYDDVDGDLYTAALSNDNTYDEIGVGTDILLFDSAGNAIDIRITNIIEEDGSISFYVFLEAQAIPDLTLLGDETLTVEYQSEFVDPGYSISLDGFEDMVTIDGTVDVNTLGDYNITYSLKDEAGNIIDSVTRLVKVIDSIQPTATLNAGVDTIEVGEEWIDAGVVVSDNYTETPDVKQYSFIDNTTPGVYQVVYRVTDESENTLRVIRYVHVVQKESYTFADFVCNDRQTTYQENEELHLGKCFYNEEEITPTNIQDVTTLQAGIVQIEYQVEIAGQTHTFRTYIFVRSTPVERVAILPKERRKYL